MALPMVLLSLLPHSAETMGNLFILKEQRLGLRNSAAFASASASRGWDSACSYT